MLWKVMPLSIQQHASVFVMPMLMVPKATSGLLVSASQLSPAFRLVSYLARCHGLILTVTV